MTPSLAARALLDAWDDAHLLDPDRFAVADIAAGLDLQARIIALRQARGEQMLGYKIGFTNRSIWPLYGVDHPIWGPVWSSTVTNLGQLTTRVSTRRWSLPRLEPEIVLGLSASPTRADVDHVFDCIDWIAHGFEIVTSPWPQWRFSAAQAVAAQGLHGALLIGPRLPRRLIAHPDTLSALRLSLSGDGRTVADGTGSAVLDGPVQALTYLVEQLLQRNQSLAPGSIITTGTLTDAQPLLPGQTWQTHLNGIDLPGLTLLTD